MKTFAKRAMILSLGFALVMPVAEAKLDSKEWSKLGKKARRAAKQGDGSSVAMLIPDIAADDSVRAVDLIGQLSMLDDNDVYEAAQAALAGMSDSKAVSHMCVKLSKGSGKWAFRVLLADAFGSRSDNESIQALNKALGDRRPEVLRSAIDAILKRRDKSSVSPLIDLLATYEKKKKNGLNVEKVREALTSLTGENFSAAVDWKSWWDPRKGNFDVPERPTTGAKPKNVGGTMERKPKFFGSELKSRRIVFVIDVSGSMRAADPAPPGGVKPPRPTSGGKAPKPDPVSKSRVRIERAKFQLELAVKALPKDARFSIIAYHGGGSGVPPKGQKILPQSDKMQWLSVFSKKLVPASSSSVKGKAVKFIRDLKPLGTTWTFNAIRSAFEIIECDNIIVLSDGAPNDPPYGKAGGAAPANPGMMGGGMSPDDILKEVKGLNNRRKLRIDTFGFDPSSAMGGARRPGGSVAGGLGGMRNPYVEFLKKLAKQNGGKFTPIK